MRANGRGHRAPFPLVGIAALLLLAWQVRVWDLPTLQGYHSGPYLGVVASWGDPCHTENVGLEIRPEVRFFRNEC